MTRRSDTHRCAGWQKLSEAMGCLIGPEDQQERLRKAMISLRQLHRPYDTKIPEDMLEDFTELTCRKSLQPTGEVSLITSRKDLSPEEREEVKDAAKQIFSLYNGMWSNVERVAEKIQEAYAELETRNQRLQQEHRELKEEHQSLKDFLPRDTKMRWRATRLVKGFERLEQSAKTKQAKPTPKKTNTSSTAKAKTTQRKTKESRKLKDG